MMVMIEKWGEQFVLLPCFMGPGSRLMACKWGAGLKSGERG
jgi:hypothetical protein